jgi:hypothetical protein
MKGAGYHSFLLDRGDRFLRSAKAMTRFRPHLDKDNGIFLPGDNINFTVRQR